MYNIQWQVETLVTFSQVAPFLLSFVLSRPNWKNPCTSSKIHVWWRKNHLWIFRLISLCLSTNGGTLSAFCFSGSNPLITVVPLLAFRHMCLLVTEAVTLGWPLLHDTRLTSSWDVTLRLTLHFHRHLLTRDFFFSLRLWQSRLGTLSASHSSSASGLFEAPVNLSVIRTFSYTPPHPLWPSPFMHTPLNSSRWAVTGPLT